MLTRLAIAPSLPSWAQRPAVESRRLLGIASVALLAATLAGCGSDASTSQGSASPSASSSSPAASATPSTPLVPAATAPVTTSSIGVGVTGTFGEKPALTVPAGKPPAGLKVEVLIPGKGKKVAKQDSLIGNYLGQTWAPKDGKVNVFDNSWDRGKPAAFQIGVGKVIQGWDLALVGQNVGSRVLLSIPAAQAYGATADGSHELAGFDLLFVVDIIDSVGINASAQGAVVENPAGYPTVENVSGKQPKITSVAGATPPKDNPKSAMLIEGTGSAIDPAKQLVLQIVQTDTATGQQTQATWGTAVEVVPAASVLEVAPVLKGKKVGSRVIALTPESDGNPSQVLILDVVSQF